MLSKSTYKRLMVGTPVLILLTPNALTNAFYQAFFNENDYLLRIGTAVLPIIVVTITLKYKVFWFKALLAGFFAMFANTILLNLSWLGLFDYGADISAHTGLRQACAGLSVIMFKSGIAAVFCFDLFLVQRVVVAQKSRKAPHHTSIPGGESL